MINFFTRNVYGKFIVYIVLSSYFVINNIIINIIVVLAQGEKINFSVLLRSPLTWLTIILNAIYTLAVQGIKSKDSEEERYYSQEDVQSYINVTTELAVEQMRYGNYRNADKTMKRQLKNVRKMGVKHNG